MVWLGGVAGWCSWGVWLGDVAGRRGLKSMVKWGGRGLWWRGLMWPSVEEFCEVLLIFDSRCGSDICGSV